MLDSGHMLFCGTPELSEADDVLRLMEEEAAAVAMAWDIPMSRVVRETVVLSTGIVKVAWYAR